MGDGDIHSGDHADDLGVLEQGKGRHRLSFTRFLPYPPEKVWRAITEPAHLAAWFPARIDGDRDAGAPLRFVFEHDEGPPGDGVVEIFEPPRVFAFTWGPESLRFELTAAEGGTILTFVNGFDELGKAVRDAAGWHYCLERLDADVDGRVYQDEPVPRWKTLERLYAEAFPPEAATIGPDPETLPDHA
jgi:uncharacterized protein YndB with AHSA1/START domain